MQGLFCREIYRNTWIQLCYLKMQIQSSRYSCILFLTYFFKKAQIWGKRLSSCLISFISRKLECLTFKLAAPLHGSDLQDEQRWNSWSLCPCYKNSKAWGKVERVKYCKRVKTKHPQNNSIKAQEIDDVPVSNFERSGIDGWTRAWIRN